MSNYDTPKTDWVSGDGITNTDLNRIEGNIEFLRDNNIYEVDDTGAVNAMVVTIDDDDLTAYVEGLTLLIKVNVTNTGAVTLNVNSLGVKAVITYDGSALTANENITNRRILVSYNGTSFNSLLHNTPLHESGTNGLRQVGTDTATVGNGATQLGLNTTASGQGAHAEGFADTAGNIEASGPGTHTEGRSIGTGTIKATGLGAHAEGYATTGDVHEATGIGSHIEGRANISAGFSSHAEGVGNIATHDGGHIMGRFGDTTESYSWFVANGIISTNRGLGAKWLNSNGQMYIDGTTYNVSGADYAEMFEWLDANELSEDRVGLFVTTEKGKIRLAKSTDDYILGIVSGNASVLGDSGTMCWSQKYLTDEFNRVLQETIIVEGIEETNRIINPEYNFQTVYKSRTERPEWSAIGMMGKLAVMDDGTCVEDGYCQVDDEGKATQATHGYRVLRRVNEHIIIVILK